MTVTTDNNNTKAFDMATLEPLGVTRQDQLHPSLTGPLSTAHASRDSKTGEIFNYNLDLGAKAVYRVFKADVENR